MIKTKKNKDVNTNTNTNKVKTTVMVSILLLSVITATAMLSAANGPPEGKHQFWGNVTVNGAPAPDGTTVVAKIGGEVRGSTTTGAGTYGASPYPAFYVTGTSGENISFYVADVYATYYIFESLQITLLDLSVGAMPDLEIAKKWVCWPDNCTICYNVTNTGSGTASAGHNTTLYVDGNETAHDQVPVDLAPGESYVGCFESYIWAYTPPEDNITVCADNNETVDESDETNNCLTNIWKCGDVDGNGYINMADVGLLWPHVFDPAGYPINNEWTGDVDGNGYINMADVGLLWPHVYYPAVYPLNCRCSS